MTQLHRRCLVGLVAVVGVLVTSVGVPAVAAKSAPVQTAWARYEFHSARSGVLLISGTVEAAPGAFFAEVAEFGANTTQPQTFADVLDLDSFSQVGTYGTAGNRDLCPGPVVCVAQNGGLGFSVTFDVEGDGHHVQDLREYFAVRGAHVVIHDRVLHGWTATHRAGGVTRRTVADANGSGAVALGQTVGTNLGVTAPGPAGGSLAVAVPGCDQAGAGALILSGGMTGETTLCPTDNVVGIAKKKTTWDATGAVAGWSSNTTRLVVLRA